MLEDIQSFFTTRPKRPASSLGAGASAEDDPAGPAFQKAWKDGALVEDLFGPNPFILHGSVGRSGWHNSNPDQAIRTFQKDKGLEVDGFLKPNGPTIGKIGSLLGGAEPPSPSDWNWATKSPPWSRWTSRTMWAMMRRKASRALLGEPVGSNPLFLLTHKRVSDDTSRDQLT